MIGRHGISQSDNVLSHANPRIVPGQVHPQSPKEMYDFSASLANQNLDAKCIAEIICQCSWVPVDLSLFVISIGEYVEITIVHANIPDLMKFRQEAIYRLSG